MLTDFAAFGVGPGNYYVRVRGVNNGVVGPRVERDQSCRSPAGARRPGRRPISPPITRGDTVYLGWNDGNGGRPASYVVHRALRAGHHRSRGDCISRDGQGTGSGRCSTSRSGGYHNVGGVPTGSLLRRWSATEPCGTSAASNEIVVNAPNNGADDAHGKRAPGRLPWFNITDLVLRIGGEARDRGYLSGTQRAFNDSCQAAAGLPLDHRTARTEQADIIELQKTQRNPLHRLHGRSYRDRFDQRFGFNAKPTRERERHHRWRRDRLPLGQRCAGRVAERLLHRHAWRTLHVRPGVGGHRPFFTKYGRWTSAGAF